MKTIIKKIIGYGFPLLLVAYILVTIITPAKTIDIFGFRTFVVISTSMEPDINKYDMIIIKKADEENLRARDIITFETYIPEVGGISYVTHYIGEITTDDNGITIYKTQGATKAPGDYDDWKDRSGNHINITFDNIQGKYVFRIPYIGFVVEMLHDPIFDVLLIANGTIIYLLIRVIKTMLHPKNTSKKEIE